MYKKISLKLINAEKKKHKNLYILKNNQTRFTEFVYLFFAISRNLLTFSLLT